MTSSPVRPAPARPAAEGWYPGLALLALVLRLAFLACEPATHPVGDERTWIGWGIQSPAGVASPEVRFSPLRTGVLFYPPGYPYFIGLWFALGGSLTAVRLAQCLTSALLVPAVGRLGARLAGPRAGTWAAALAAVYPDFIWFATHFWSETLFLVLLWWGFERLAAAREVGRVRTAVAAGVLWGLAVLTRETSLYFTPWAALWLAWPERGPKPADTNAAPRRAGVRLALAFLLASLACVLPWTLRNRLVFEAFIPVSTAGGLNLWQGNALLTRQEVYDRYQAVQGLVEQYRHARRLGLEAIRARQPGWLFEKLVAELPLFWEADSLALVHARRGAYGPVSRRSLIWAATVVLAPYLGLLAAAVAAGLYARTERRLAWLLLGFLVFYMLLHVATHGFARYRLPVMPVLMVVAAAFLAQPRPRPVPSPARRLATLTLALALIASVAPSLAAWVSYALGGPRAPAAAEP